MTPPGDDDSNPPTDSSDGVGDVSDSTHQQAPPANADEKKPKAESGNENASPVESSNQEVEREQSDETGRFGEDGDGQYGEDGDGQYGEDGDGQYGEDGKNDTEQYGVDDSSDGDDKPNEWLLLGRDVGISILAVALIGTYLFAISGVWPPMVAIESGSMEPNMNENDLVFVMESDRFQPDVGGDSGIVSAEEGEEHDYTKFGYYGDVIVYAPNGNTEQTPIIHRAMFWVDEGDDWVEKANEDHLGSVESCDDVETVCPAPNDGFITKGDNERTNQVYDQVNGEKPVNPEWVVGTAEVRVPGIGWLRLQFE